MTSIQVRRLTYAALFLAIAMVLPFVTGQIPEIGNMLCPMHIYVRLALGADGRVYRAAAAVCRFWYARAVSRGGCHGV